VAGPRIATPAHATRAGERPSVRPAAQRPRAEKRLEALGGTHGTWGAQIPMDLAMVTQLRFVAAGGRPRWSPTSTPAAPGGLADRSLRPLVSRSILRMAGPVYQFRHARLQDRLAAQESAPGQCPGEARPAGGDAAAPTAEAPPQAPSAPAAAASLAGSQKTPG
jgi:hypothetical protein